VANPNEFFLPPDEAQSLGNTDYMRKKVTIRRTFPKTASNKTTEVIKEVSSTTDRVVSKGGTSVPSNNGFSNNENSFVPQNNINNNSNAEPIQQEPSFEPSAEAERRRSSNNMDMFRNMARNIRK
jgi:hypothetical protein